jgi:hypothetical protein
MLGKALCVEKFSRVGHVTCTWVSCLNATVQRTHESTTTAKNMGILKYHPTSLISYERGWPLACLEDLIKPNQASMLKVPVLALIIETSAV